MSIFRKTLEQKLFRAIDRSKAYKITELLAKGANVNALNTRGMSPLDLVTKQIKDYESVRGVGGSHDQYQVYIYKIWNELAKNGAKLNKYKGEKLFEAIEASDVKKLREYIAVGADLNAQNALRLTPLDTVAEQINDIIGPGGQASGLNAGHLSKLFNLNLIWDELVRSGGILNKYKNDPLYDSNFNINLDVKDIFQGPSKSKLDFKAPKPQ